MTATIDDLNNTVTTLASNVASLTTAINAEKAFLDAAAAGGATAAALLATIRTPESFGATGNNSALDTAAFLAFQTWATALPSGSVAVLNCKPGSTYLVANPYWPCNIRKLRVYGSGCSIQNSATINQDKSLLNPVFGFDKDGQGTFYNGVNNYLISTTARGDTSVTTITPADAGNFAAGETVCVASFDQQYSGSQPPSCRFFEYAKVQSVNATTGAVSLDRRLRYAHQSDFPYMPQPSYVNSDGRARIYKIEQGSLFDIDHEYNDITFVRNSVNSSNAVSEAVYCSGMNVRFNRCKSPWFLATAVREAEFTDCEEQLAGGTQALTGGELDKMVGTIKINGGTWRNKLYAASGVNLLRIERARLLGGYEIAPKVLELIDCDVRDATKIFEAYSRCDRITIQGGSHESLPTAGIGTGVVRKVTLGTTGVTWSGTQLTVDLNAATDNMRQFVSSCYPGAFVYVGIADGQGNTLPTGVFAQVSAITGSLNSATITLPFNTALAGTETLIVLTEPIITDIRDVEVAGKMVRQNSLRHSRTYTVKDLLIRTAPGGTINAAKVFGRVKRITVDVLRPYTGATTGNVMLLFRSLYIGSYGAQLNRNIDLKTAGRREATLNGFSGWTGTGGESAGAVLAGGSIASMFCTAIDITAPTIASASDAELPIVSIEIEFENPLED